MLFLCDQLLSLWTVSVVGCTPPCHVLSFLMMRIPADTDLQTNIFLISWLTPTRPSRLLLHISSSWSHLWGMKPPFCMLPQHGVFFSTHSFIHSFIHSLSQKKWSCKAPCWAAIAHSPSRVRVGAMDWSTPGLPVPHCLPEFAQVHVHWVGDAIQPSHPLLPS